MKFEPPSREWLERMTADEPDCDVWACSPELMKEILMTIVFQGHVERVELGADSKLDVHVQTAAAECGQVVVLRVPRSAAAHWQPGRMVSFTVYALEPKTVDA